MERRFKMQLGISGGLHLLVVACVIYFTATAARPSAGVIYLSGVYMAEADIKLGTGGSSIAMKPAGKQERTVLRGTTGETAGKDTAPVQTMAILQAVALQKRSGTKPEGKAAAPASGADPEASPPAATYLGQARADKTINYYRDLENAMRSWLCAEIPEQERVLLHGEAAIVEIEYLANGRMGMASVSAPGETRLVRILHEKIRWAALPAPGHYDLAREIVKFTVLITETGGVNIGFI